MAPPSKKRRTHYKSRKGCQQCKQRHVKCDEQWPNCIQCSITARSCVYVYAESNDNQVSECTLSPITFADQSPTQPLTPTSSLDAQSEIRCISVSPLDPVIQEVPPQQVFDLNHLALLYHVQTDLLKPPYSHLVADKEDAQNLLRMIITTALSTPYLMDALLAFSALHLSVLASDLTMQHHYRQQAVRLQTRALALYNAACPEITEQNCIALFLYSSFIGLHMLHDTVASRADLLELLDRFVQFAGLYHGVATVTNRAWHIIRDSELSGIITQIEAADNAEQASENICDALTSLLNTAVDRLGLSSFEACHDAVQSLRWVFNRQKILPAPISRDIVLAWPVHISTKYLQLLRERQPEALVIMAYWAVLLHYERDFWVFGHGGRYLIEAISNYLGDYWDQWMALPREIIKINPL